MPRRLLPILVVLLAGALALPAAAITYGEPDAGEHPYVGMLFFYDPTELDSRFTDPGAWFSCSGTLVSPTVVLTAGHCVYGVGLGGEPAISGGNDIWVTFKESDSLVGLPPSSGFVPDGNAARYVAWVRYLTRSKNWVRGTAIPYEGYGMGFPNTGDIGVVILDKPVRSRTFGALPELGYLDGLATRRGQHRDDLLVETVGYGMLEVHPVYDPNWYDARYKATSTIVNLGSALTDGYNLHTSNNASEVGGAGGSCFGDSGGPLFASTNSNVIVGVVSFGMNGNCRGADYAYRADISITQDFLARFRVTP
jgi:hypothetical protein